MSSESVTGNAAEAGAAKKDIAPIKSSTIITGHDHREVQTVCGASTLRDVFAIVDDIRADNSHLQVGETLILQMTVKGQPYQFKYVIGKNVNFEAHTFNSFVSLVSLISEDIAENNLQDRLEVRTHENSEDSVTLLPKGDLESLQFSSEIVPPGCESISQLLFPAGADSGIFVD